MEQEDMGRAPWAAGFLDGWWVRGTGHHKPITSSLQVEA